MHQMQLHLICGHLLASWLVMRGVSLRIVQAILGHASIRQTEIYAHLAPGYAFHGAVALLDVPLAPSVAPVSKCYRRPGSSGLARG